MELDARKQKILQGVVWCYVETAEPVGSENLAQRYSDWGVKSATIRNTLADLAEMGYLRQPHTSAGRIPSDRGYRFYVNHLVGERELDPEAAERARIELDSERAESLDRILRQTCALLSQMTRYTSVATRPRPADVSLRQVFASVAVADTVLIVVLLSTGETTTRLLVGDPAALATSEPAALTSAINAFNSVWAGKTVEVLASGEGEAYTIPDDLRMPAAVRIYAAISEAVRHMASHAAQEQPVVEGAREILRQPEFQDVVKLDGVLEVLQTQANMAQFLSVTNRRTEITAVIGSENPVEAMRDCAVVSAPYYAGTRERGTLAVVGPTRMDYDRTLPAVSFMARSLSSVLSGLT